MMRVRSFWNASFVLLTLVGNSWLVAAQDETQPAHDVTQPASDPAPNPAKTYKPARPVISGRSWGGHSTRSPNNNDLMLANSALQKALTGRAFKRRMTTNSTSAPSGNLRNRIRNREGFFRGGGRAVYHLVIGDLDIATNGSCAEDIKTFCPDELKQWSEVAETTDAAEQTTPEEQTEAAQTNEVHSEGETPSASEGDAAPSEEVLSVAAQEEQGAGDNTNASEDGAAPAGEEQGDSVATSRHLLQEANTTAVQKSGGMAQRNMKIGEYLQRLIRTRKGLMESKRNQKDPLGELKQIGFPEDGKGNAFTNAPIARCLRKNIRSQRFALLAAQKPQVSSQCKAEAREFWQARASDVRRDLPLLGACIGDIQMRCNSTDVGMGRVLRCLKNFKPQLNPRCAAAVTARQVESAEDISLDAPLQALCAAELQGMCADVGYGGGARLACLKESRPKLSAKCSAEVFRREVEDSEDVRFQYRLAAACAAEKERFCAAEPTGRARTLVCLQAHAEEVDFSAECKAEVEKSAQAAATDWRLDWRLRTFCFKDAKTLCNEERLAAKQSTMSEASNRTSVLECLNQNIQQVQSEPCKRHLTRRISMAAGDIRYDMPMAVACYKEIRSVCRDVKPGGGRIQMCLESNKDKLSQRCGKKLLERHITQADNWRFKHGIFSNCKAERKTLCGDVKEGANRIASCLQDKLGDPAMSPQCRAAVSRDEVKSTGDVRLLPEVASQCAADMKELCPKVQPGRGRVLKCLKTKRSEIGSPGCRMAILRQLMRAAENWKLDRPLAEKCMGDVLKLCRGIQPGDGRVHACLRRNEDKLTPECREEEARLEAAEAEDIRMKPWVRRVCQEAISEHCKDLAPGDSRILTCLKEKASEPGFPAACGGRMRAEVRRAASRTALNPRVTKACHNELKRQCPGAASATNADGLKCLVHGFQWTNHFCQSEVGRSVRIALNLYRHDTPLIQDCDEDARRWCSFEEPFAAYVKSGSVAQCLLRSSGNLTGNCWKLVSISVDGADGAGLPHPWDKAAADAKTSGPKGSSSRSLSSVNAFVLGMGIVVVIGGVVAFALKDRLALAFSRPSTKLKGYVVVDKS
mmetsp:Transcript_33669/g.73502  ORF Transcript_33669/g.73502 Transcript_33669/m.73502 type:complete len:1091 (-) Transcript_33669:561-3833(-)